MSAPVILVPLALEWLLIVTALTPLTFRGKFRNHPSVGICLWVALFFSSLISLLALFVVTIWSLFELIEVGANSKMLPLELASNLGIWAVLAMGGIALAQINQRTETLGQEARELRPELAKAAIADGEFQGFALHRIELPVPLVFTGGRNVYFTSAAKDVLSDSEFEAALWHEIGHIRGRHAGIRAIAGLANVLTPRIRASQIMIQELGYLTELAADKFAATKVSDELLASARAKFLE